MQIRVATYNVENLFGDGPEAKPNAGIRALARMIQLVDADIVLLQEVGSLGVLKHLNDRLERPYEQVGLLEGNSNRSIHLGTLCRLPCTLTSHKSAPLYDRLGTRLRGFLNEEDAVAAKKSDLYLQRDLLRVDCEIAGLRFAFYTVHLKSKWSPPWADVGSDELREAEARTVTRLIVDFRDEHPDAYVLLMGDFNDAGSSDAMAPIRQLNFVDSHKVWFQSMGRNPTTYWPKRRRRIDRIYLSPETADLVVPGSQVIHAGEMAKQASDHYPVSIVVELPNFQD
ncbi:MAG: hypothetical protein GKR90_09365 [Pseudomonadales bacterium]|nr:hypothetical protein [Pseudomonadales bacterium]